MDCSKVTRGLLVRTKGVDKSTGGMLVPLKHLEARAEGVVGTVMNYVPGHGGDVWFVQHDTGEIAVYTFNEFEPEIG